MKKITTTITYRVPNFDSCSFSEKALCRFCIKNRNGAYCALYNEPISVTGSKVSKVHSCIRAIAGHKSVVEDVVAQPAADTPVIAPQLLMKLAVKEFLGTYKSLKAQGYPESIAEKVAMEALIK